MPKLKWFSVSDFFCSMFLIGYAYHPREWCDVPEGWTQPVLVLFLGPYGLKFTFPNLKEISDGRTDEG